ncbi:hypothetical protein ACP4OV_029633 [Aristida adscensionis]
MSSSSAMEPRLPYSVKEDLRRTATITLIYCWLFAPVLFLLLVRFGPPTFSVELVDASGLDAPAPASPAQGAPPISTAFNLTLHAANRRHRGRCYRPGEAAVRYAGYTVGWGRTRGFCVGAGEARRVPVVAWADGVGLPGPIRERMAAELRGGAAELDVDVRLFRGDDDSARPTWVSCKVKAGGAKPPPGASRCTMFALQNWASDIVPSWMRTF